MKVVCESGAHLFLKSCMRCRKAQMEVCLALDRRNSAYLLENSRSPSCLLRSRPAGSSCLKPSKATFPITSTTSLASFMSFLDTHRLQVFFKYISNPPRSSSDVLALHRTSHLSLASRSTSAGSSHGVSTCLPRDRKRSTSSSSLRTFQNNPKHFNSEEVNLAVRPVRFTWQEAMKANRRGPPGG